MLSANFYKATWPSGKARVCKTLITGSNPVVASKAKAPEIPGKTANAIKPFQKEGVEWALQKLGDKGSCLIGDEMGLGKTLQALCTVKADDRVLVIGPASVQRNWEAEIKKWRPDLKATCVDRQGFRWPNKGEVVISRWTSLPIRNLSAGKGKRGLDRSKAIDAELVKILGTCPQGIKIVADEIHYIKSSKAQRHQAFRSVARLVRWNSGTILGLTGTPMLNNPLETWNILQCIGAAKHVCSRDDYFRLCNIRRNRWGGYDFGTPNEEVAELLRNVILRRLSADVLTLPPITRKTVTVPLDAQAKAACDALLSWAGGKESLEVLLADAMDGKAGARGQALFERLSAMRRAVALAKIPEMLSRVKQEKQPVAVFSCHRGPVEVLKKKGFAIITGSETAEQKYDAVCSFQDGEKKGVAYTLAGCEGITLTRAAKLFVVSADWTPARNSQAEGRLWRIGQDNPVEIVYLVGNHVAEQVLHAALERKRKILDATGMNGS